MPERLSEAVILATLGAVVIIAVVHALWLVAGIAAFVQVLFFLLTHPAP